MRDHGKRFGREQLRSLGRRIRALRQARNWSLKRLSVNCEVSVAAIQKIEAGAANPSLLTVIAIVEALGESVDDLISVAHSPDRTVTVVRGELPVRASGSIDLSPALADRRMHCWIEALPARQRPPNGGKAAAGEPQFGYVLDGALRLSFGDDVTQLGVGDSFHAAADAAFECSNPIARKSLVLRIADGGDRSRTT